MVRQYGSFSTWSFSLSLLLMASSLLSVISFAMEGTKLGTPSSVEEKIHTFAKRHVTITNDLGDGLVLKIHCKSKDDDLGIHYLSFQYKFEWEFKVNAFIPDTLFYCYMWWGNNVNGSFDIYREDRDDDRCTDCQWSIRSDGIYSKNPKTNTFELMYRWSQP